MTKGEYRVGISFNPSMSGAVSDIKQAAARLIDLVETIRLDGQSPEGQQRWPV